MPAKKRGVGDKPTPRPRRQYDKDYRRPPSAKEKNEMQLAQDLRQYENTGKIPRYRPIYQRVGGKRKIKRYENTTTGQRVSAYYRRQFGKAFTYIPTEDVPTTTLLGYVDRANDYYDSIKKSRAAGRRTTASIVESYKLKVEADTGVKLTTRQVLADPFFQDRVDLLYMYSGQQHVFTSSNYEQMVEGSPIDAGTKQKNAEIARGLRLEVGSQPEYQQVLVDLGRRLDGDERPVGSYPVGELKARVQPILREAAERREIQESFF
jgi:hypothetical protein